jgi:hypothetical protein
MAWRKGWFSARLWLGELSEDHRLLWGREIDFSRIWRLTDEDWLEDPRLIVAGNKVLVAFTFVRHGNIFMALATLDEGLEVADCRIFDTEHRRGEKNWQFFEHDQALRVVYYPNPHTVGWKAGQEMRMPAADGARLPWAWGEVRGGTPPVRVGDEYFSFFHSSLHCHYVAGFYAFEAKPPFRVTRWPKEPCMVAAKDKWRGGHAVVFPGGAILENGKWLVAYGWQDAFCCLAWYDHEELLASLETRTLSPVAATLPGQTPCVKRFRMEPPQAAVPERQVCVKLVTAFVDLNRHERRPEGKDAASYREHARHLFAGNPPLIVWLDCGNDLTAQIREAAAPYTNITVREFHVEETETWRALARERFRASDRQDSIMLGLLKTELVARSICEGDIPEGMQAGWIDFAIADDPELTVRIGESLLEGGSSREERLQLFHQSMEQGNGDDCQRVSFRSFKGPPMLMLKFAGEVLQTLRAMLARGEPVHETRVMAEVRERHPHWFAAPLCLHNFPCCDVASPNHACCSGTLMISARHSGAAVPTLTFQSQTIPSPSPPWSVPGSGGR